MLGYALLPSRRITTSGAVVPSSALTPRTTGSVDSRLDSVETYTTG